MNNDNINVTTNNESQTVGQATDDFINEMYAEAAQMMGITVEELLARGL